MNNISLKEFKNMVETDEMYLTYLNRDMIFYEIEKYQKNPLFVQGAKEPYYLKDHNFNNVINKGFSEKRFFEDNFDRVMELKNTFSNLLELQDNIMQEFEQYYNAQNTTFQNAVFMINNSPAYTKTFNNIINIKDNLNLTKDEYKAINRVIKSNVFNTNGALQSYSSKQVNKMLKNYTLLDEDYIKKTNEILIKISNLIKVFARLENQLKLAYSKTNETATKTSKTQTFTSFVKVNKKLVNDMLIFKDKSKTLLNQSQDIKDYTYFNKFDNELKYQYQK